MNANEICTNKGKEPITSKQVNKIKKNNTLNSAESPNNSVLPEKKIVKGNNQKHSSPRLEESIAYPNEVINKNMNIDKSDNRSNIVMMRGSSYYNLREENLIIDNQGSYHENPDLPINPISGILRDPKDGTYHHQWVKYKTPTPYFCQVCNKRVSNGPLDYDYHCVW